MKRIPTAAFLLGLAGAPALAADPAQDLLDEAAHDCAAYENGKFDAKDAVSRIDLDGDGTPDTMVDTSKFECTSGASLYCGSGGCMVRAVIGEEGWDFQVDGWRMTDWDGRPILLIQRDGGWCGASSAQVCYEAVVWNDGRMLSVMPEN